MNARIIALAALVVMAACSGARSKSSVVSSGMDGCRIAASSTAPLVVEWNGAMRGRLEALRSKHVIAVRHSGCELELLPACTVNSEYTYSPLTPKRDRVVVRDEDELYANLPLHAVSLSAKLRAAGQLNVDMTMVGRFEAQAKTLTSNQLEGECAGATHVITGLTTGAFNFYAGASSENQGGISIAGAGAGQQSSASVDVLNRDGDPAACSRTAANDKSPPFGCGAIIRIELAPIGGSGSTTPGCASPLAWDGKQCASPAHATRESAAPEGCVTGAPLDQGGCPPGPPPCPRGTHHEGAGCAPDAMASGAMVRIPAGTYRWAGRSHVLRVAEFDLDVTEVTLAQFKKCVDAGTCVPPRSAGRACNWGKDGRARHPMNCVAWSEAKTYCEWAGKRLPTDIEWEYAAVGQTGWTYPWGNAKPDITRSCRVKESTLETCPVGSFPAGQSRFGILDMSGNVAEWTLDAWCGGGFDCLGCDCSGDSRRAVRNGLPSAQRNGIPSAHSRSDLGFRCARNVGASSPRRCPAGTAYALDQCVPDNDERRCPPGMHRNQFWCVPDGSP
jgi:hypothetical protein